MKAIVYHRYGSPDVVSLAEVPKPVPKDNEVLIRIYASTVTTGDWRARSLDLPAGFGFMGRLVFGVFGPRQPILGTELAGEIEAVGRAVTRFKTGDQVFAFPGGKYGGHAEYRTMPEDGMIALKPANLSFEEAAALSFGGTTALAFLRDLAGIKAGDKVLVVGASGGVGTAAVQIARSFGAIVTGVTSTSNLELVRSIGADNVIDYTKEDFSQSGDSWDIILDTTGTAPFARSERVLKPGGRLLVVLGSLAQAMGIGRPAKASGKTVIAAVPKITVEHMQFLAKLAEAGRFKPVIDRGYPLENAAEAHAYVDTGRKRGNVVLTVRQVAAKVEGRPRAMARN
ncbi:MAG: NAD(P)-dependent alcohol dehydrogenase [Devosia sp.]|uniref:NAD(P)-dependent alcohol dehydrogenase n=1 Tax=Devosia sp. TaxID=1871048 RepID=UPI00262FC759|nr:NAD(P)-dependent alcohol dehydrogenase [Devosia sp.]MDB5538513.1 NAD(P)-dependent alcohol dehydrogenase [Devosia sp.]